MLVAAGIKIGMLGTEKYADPDILITVGIILSLAGFNWPQVGYWSEGASCTCYANSVL